jgi:tryptophan-rich sensory protein
MEFLPWFWYIVLTMKLPGSSHLNQNTMLTARLIRILNIVFFGLMIFVNYLAIVYELGGNSMPELSDKYANLFTPANITFSIWSLIYLLLAGFLVSQFMSKTQTRITRNYLFILSCIFNFSWILVWQYEYTMLSVLVMLALLATLAKMNLQIREDGNEFYKIVFGIYLGWICIATIANVTALFVSLNAMPSVDVQVLVTIAMIIIGLVLVSFIMMKLDNPYLGLSVAWAFYGVSLKRDEDFPPIALAAKLAMAGVILATIWIFYRRRAAKS